MTLYVSVIGVGFIGNIHLSCFEEIPEVQISGIVDRKNGLQEKYSQKHRCKGYSDVCHLLVNDNVDVIDICVPTPFHKEIATAAAQAGKHIICEKPIARTIADAQEMAFVAERNNVKLFIGQVLRFFPEYVRIRERVKQGEVGKPGIIRTFRGGASPIPRASWYGDIERSGGILVDMLIHDFDWLRWTVGEVKSVYAQGLTFKEGDRDLALVNLRFKNGSLAHVEGSWAHPSNYPFTTKVEIAGTKGLIQFDSGESSPLRIYSQKAEDGETRAPESPLSKNPWHLELEHFIDCLKNDQEPIVKVTDSIEALKISLAAVESLEKGKPVEVSDIHE